jgi:cholesterol transport system auxiliary component
MATTMVKQGVCLVVLIAGAACSGCLGTRSYTQRQFVLDVSPPAAAASQGGTAILAVRPFTIGPAFSSQGLVHRKTSSEYEVDFYNEFLIAPQVMIATATRRWLTASGLFQAVLEPDSLVEPTHVLEGNVLALYGDFRDRSAPSAHLTLRVFLLDVANRSSPAVVLDKTYTAGSALALPSPEGLVAALDLCLQTVLEELDKDLAAKF